jgi:hypothetical protein
MGSLAGGAGARQRPVRADRMQGTISGGRWKGRLVVVLQCVVRVSLSAGLVGLIMFPMASRASADDLMIIRCVGYEEPIVVSGHRIYAKNDQSFDIFLSPSRGIGWWSGALFNIDEDHPAKLTIDPATYRLEAENIFDGHKWTEWIVIDRISSSMAQFGRVEGAPSGETKRGGNCANLKPKF